MKRKLIAVCSIITCLILLGAIFPQGEIGGLERTQQETNERVKAEIVGNPPNANEPVINMANLETSNNLQKYGVEIVGPSDSEFDVELKRLTGDSTEEFDPLIDVAKPISVIIINNSSKDVVGCSLKWEMLTPKGANQHPQIQSTPGVLMGMKPRDPKMKGRTSLISAGDAKLFSYDPTIDQIFQNVKMNRGNDQHLGPARRFQADDTLLRPINDIKNNLLKSVSRFSVSIDGIFFSDGTFAGADSFFYFDLMRGQVKAHNDFISLLSESNSSGVLSTHLTSYTTKSKGRQSSSRPDNPEAAFQQGYDRKTWSLAKEISRRRTKFIDVIIAQDFLANQHSNQIVLRKLK